MVGTYTWSVTYEGNANNRTVTETGSASNGEQTVVSPANPMLVTTAGQAISQGTRAATLTDTAVLSGGYFPTGSIVFMVTSPAGFSYTQTDPVSGNGTYTASTPLPTTGTVAGTYTWTAHYVGDANNNAADDQGAAEQAIVAPNSPTLVTTASPALTLGTAAPTLSDAAELADGLNPTGSIVFTLTGPGGFSYTQTDPVSGNGTYTASTTLPTTGTVAGTYTWSATYEGDVNNNVAIDQGGPTEQTVVSPANPTLVTTASAAITLTTTAPMLSDSAVLSGGYFPGGSIVFTLTGPNGFSYTQTDTVSGNATYTASTVLPTTGTVVGTYIWSVTYQGDANNNAADDQGGPTERTVVNPASPTIVTTASPTTVTLPTGPAGTVTLTDSAVLSGGYFPGGSIVFTLSGPNSFSYTQTDPVSGNSTYTASTMLPTTGTVAGTYTWSVTYEGNANNRTVTETGSASNGEQTVVSPANPMLVTTASPALTLGTTAPTVSDSAVLSGGLNPTGSIVFTLTGPNSFSYTQTDTVSGNGTYTASTVLATTGTVAGTYTWSVTYEGDVNNNAAMDQGGPTEQTVVSPANPTIVTTASPAITLGTTAPTLSDSAVLSGGYFPGGSIVFTLSGPNGFSYTQTDPVSGNATYTASTTLATTGTVVGTYTWSVTYEGDVNNNAASDQGGAAEQTVVSPASPTIVTTASANVTLPTGPPGTVTLTDSAVLSGGYFPGGSIVFTLTGPNSFSYTQTDPVSGNATYTASTTLPTTGTVAGTYTWSVTYEGNANNRSVTETGSASNGEQTVVNPASPTLTTAPSATTVTLGTTAPTLKDTATLSGGYFETGSITFTLYYNGGSSPVDTETVTVSGNGTYTTPTGFTLPLTATATGTYQWDATYSGDTNNNTVSDNNAANEQVVVSPANPTITTTPNVTTVTLGTSSVTLTDTADLEGGYSPTGTITFTLFLGSTLVDTETVSPVSGNGTYTTPTGYALPTTGTVTGTYQWDASYSGDTNNNTVSDTNASNEQVMVSPASPTLTTTPGATVVLGSGTYLTDTALLSGSYYGIGSITFYLFAPGVTPDGTNSNNVYSNTMTVSGNGTYETVSGSNPGGYLPTEAGTYQWVVGYSGDSNNNGATSTFTSEPQVVSPASPTLTTTPGGTVVIGSGTNLSDSARLSGSYNGIGSITFYLFAPGVTPDGTNSNNVYSNTVTVSGNGTYTTASGSNPGGYLPTATGTYEWVAGYSGDSNNNGATSTFTSEPQVVSPASPTLVTTPSTTTVTLGTSSVTLNDTANLEGGYSPTGTITFTLFLGSTKVDTETATVSGNGTYTTATGYTLPTTGTVTGTYQWDASYSGDTFNNTASDTGASNEQVVVSPASPTITTSPSPTTITLGDATPLLLTDTATLAGGYHPSGTITFTLFQANDLVDTETATVNGNGTYTTPTGYTLPSTATVTGTYQWDATYSGDTNNNAASDNNNTNEQVTVSAASPTLTTSPSPTTITLSDATPPLLTDTATLAGGYHPSGTITFTLFLGSTLVDTQEATVSGNGTYSTPDGYPLETAGTATGTYQWDATYSGDTNNNSVSDNNNTNEQVMVNPASPTLTTTPGATVVVGSGTNLTDSAVLSGSYYGTGSITFYLFAPEVTPDGTNSNNVYSNTMTVSGNGTYETVSGSNPGGYLPTEAGTYQWVVSYSGDSNNQVATSTFTSEPQVVSPASPSFTTTPGGTVVIGSGTNLSDSARLAGSYNGTGSITFYLFAPGVTPDVTNSNNVYSNTVTVSGNGTYTTASGSNPGGYLPTEAGTYEWVAGYSGDSNNNGATSAFTSEPQVVGGPANLTLSTTPNVTTVTLGTSPVTLTDTADLAGGHSPTGTITFTLFLGSTLVDTEMVTVNGNGTYSTPNGYTLPTTGTVTGTYQWDASYSGDINDNAVSEIGASNEQVMVSPASPSITTTPSATAVTLGASSVTLTDTANLEGGYSPTGTITFTLFRGNVLVDTETATVSGNGTYSTPTGYTLPTTNTVTGTYQWDATYSGDTNNNTVRDNNAANEQVVVSPTNPTITTTPNVTTVTLGTSSVTLTDTATLAGGYHPSGTITFTLFLGSTLVHTETASPVSGNGTYTTPTGYALPTTGTVTGTYQWDTSYSGDTNNNTASDTNASNEQVMVSPASPTLTTTPGATVVVGSGTNLTDSAVLSGSYHGTGSITFYLFEPGVAPDGTNSNNVYSNTVTVSGNGTYETVSGSNPGGYLPTEAGTYQWVVSYTGDSNNHEATSTFTSEPQVVSPASPSLTTTPGGTVVIGSGTNLSDSARLSGTHNGTGSITFYLFAPGVTPDGTDSNNVYSNTVTVSGNGTYTTASGNNPGGYLPTEAGTYEWVASYSGDSNNNGATSTFTSEPQVVSPASPTLTTTPNVTTVTLGTSSVTLKDTADLEGGYSPTGSITFTLFLGSTKVYTETATVSGNGTYTTATGYMLPSTGTVTGTYQWDATYSGDTNNKTVSDNNNTNEQVVVSPASPTITTTPSATAVTLGTSSVTLKDTADLEGGYSPIGIIIFTLFRGNNLVDIETVTVSGNGMYTTPTGYTLPTNTTGTGTYQWNASYTGDTNNNTVRDNNAANEQVVVSPASPTITTTPNVTTVTLGTSSVTLTDTATLAGGYHPSGTITFTLFLGSTLVDTQTATVSGNGAYTTPDGYLLPTTSTVAGTYHWDATYNGDGNNLTATGTNEQVTVNKANPTITTSPNLTSITLSSDTPPLLTDTATLAGGYHETGTITFTLFLGSTLVNTQTATVSGNGTYTTPTGYTLPNTGTVTGTYQWDATYNGDGNNNAVSDTNASNEQVTVNKANPTITTSPNPTSITLSSATPPLLTDTATLAGGYHETGTITFTLFLGSTLVNTQTATVSGNGTYSTPTGYTLPTTGTVTGTYQWDATYNGNGNNLMASDIGASNEQVTVNKASPTLSTTPSPTTITLSNATPPVLTDTATLAGGYHETGTITFTLFLGSTLVDTETATVSGNGTYSTPTGYTLPTTGTVTGTYQWDATYNGDTNNNTVSDNNATNERATVSTASPTITTTPSPTIITLSSATPPVLTDTATLAGGYHETGSITFTLFLGSTKVDTEMVTVSGNGSYTTPTGYTLPTTGTVTGTYQWDASYSGDTNNNAASDNNAANEQVVVSPANPTIVTTASPPTVTLGTTAPTLSDSAVLSGGYFPTGNIDFTLSGPGGFSYTQTDTVSGNGTYTASTTLPTTGTVAGTFTWTVTYGGNANNNAVTDTGTATNGEQTVVSPASPMIVTTASPAITLGTTAPTLSDSAVLSGGYFPGGSIVFTLTGPAGFSYTQTDTVSGNATYTASTVLASTGTVVGTYTWSVTYQGDVNNHAANDQGGPTERTMVSPANPTIVTTASPAITLGTTAPTLSDSAVLSGGYFPTGSIVFTLTGPNSFSYTQTDPVSGNATYTASTTLPTTGTVVGTYTWSVTYEGNANNRSVTETGSASNGEQTVVSPANPMLVTTAGQAISQGTRAATLTDTAVLSGGYFPTGSIVFMVTSPAGFSYTQTDPVSGNGTYTASTPLPTTGTVAGTYTWTAHYVGDANNNAADDQGDVAEQAIVAPTSPTLVTTASPALTLGTAAPTVSDSAVLSGGLNPTGSIVFTLTGPGGFSYTQTDLVSGNGTYTASTALATTGTVAGTYTWSATYEGDVNNNVAMDQGGPTEQTVVSPANPTLFTLPTPGILGPNPVTLRDTALLEGGFNPRGTITFMLFYNGGSVPVDTETVTVVGDGAYVTPTGYTLPTTGAVAGTYQWFASYSGDVNNHAANDQGGPTERTMVSPANPTIVTTASPAITLGTTAPTLSDSAVLSGGYFPTGSIVFTLTGPNSFSYTQTDPVSGNATYTASTTLPTTGTVVGTYTWSVTYEGNANNRSITETGKREQRRADPGQPGQPDDRDDGRPGPQAGYQGRDPDRRGAAVGGLLPDGQHRLHADRSGGLLVHPDRPGQRQRHLRGQHAASDHGNGGGNLHVDGPLCRRRQQQRRRRPGGGRRAADRRPDQPDAGDDGESGPDAGDRGPDRERLGGAVGRLEPDRQHRLHADRSGGFSYTQTDLVSGNGTYTASTALATTGTVAGTYTWSATYEGDVNNNVAMDQGGPTEQTVVRPANPKQ